MKRLELTPQLTQMIRDRVGPDVNLDGIAVFESVSLNDKPLPGKKGTIWEGAVALPSTLVAIAETLSAIDGGGMPLMINHNMQDMPVGRVFVAGVDYTADGGFELRTLFYIDPTEAELADKVDAAAIDEVSISFLPQSYLCSACGFDYLGPDATVENLWNRTCANDHVVGTDGVYVDMVGCADLIELSLVARGAADNPKIVGRSNSKLAPQSNAPMQRLAARGFEIDRLVCQASKGEYQVDTNKLVSDFVAAQSRVAVLEAAAAGHDATLTAARTAATEAQTALTAAQETIVTLTGERDTALSTSRTADAEAATTWLTTSLTKLLTAAGKSVENLPTDIAALTAAIDVETKGLTAIIPVGGVTVAAGENNQDAPAKVDLSAFKTNRK